MPKQWLWLRRKIGSFEAWKRVLSNRVTVLSVSVVVSLEINRRHYFLSANVFARDQVFRINYNDCFIDSYKRIKIKPDLMKQRKGKKRDDQSVPL